MKVCSVEACGGKHFGRGLCQMHYAQWSRHGYPAASPSSRGLSLEQRMSKYIARGEGCCVWTGTLKDGYGQIKISGRMRYAHIVMYEMQVGPVPDGMSIDHRCRNRRCVRPDHLRLATTKQNMENLSGPNKNNTSGVRGVTWHKQSRKWVATVTHNKQRIHVGAFATAEEAGEAARVKRNELFTHNDLDRKAAA